MLDECRPLTSATRCHLLLKVLGLCLEHSLKSIFGCSQISTLLSDLFIGNIVKSTR